MHCEEIRQQLKEVGTGHFIWCWFTLYHVVPFQCCVRFGTEFFAITLKKLPNWAHYKKHFNVLSFLSSERALKKTDQSPAAFWIHSDYSQVLFCTPKSDTKTIQTKHVLTTWQADDRVAKCLADIRQAHDDSIESKQVGSIPCQVCLVEICGINVDNVGELSWIIKHDVLYIM